MSFLFNALRLLAVISPFPFYSYLWWNPQKFVDIACTDGADPSHRMQQVSSVLKTLQIITLLSTASFESHWFPPWWSILLFIGGQYLNVRAYQLLGEAGIYYGTRFGKTIPWCKEFPYGTIRDPQYVGSVMSLIAVTCWVPWRWILPWIGGYLWMVRVYASGLVVGWKTHSNPLVKMEVESKEPKTKAKVALAPAPAEKTKSKKVT